LADPIRVLTRIARHASTPRDARRGGFLHWETDMDIEHPVQQQLDAYNAHDI
jgi:hypothetical protein